MRKRSYAAFLSLALLASVVVSQSARAAFSSVDLQVSDGSVTSTAPAAIAPSENSILGFRGTDGYPHSMECGDFIVCDLPASGTSAPGSISLSDEISRLRFDKQDHLGQGVQDSVLMWDDYQILWNRLYSSHIWETSERVFVTAQERDKLATMSGTNTGDQDLSALVPKTTTVNGHALSGNVTVTKSDVGLGRVVNADTTTTSNISDSSDKRFVTDAEKTKLYSLSGTNTGDQDLSGLVPKTTKVNGQALTGDITVSSSTTAAGITDSTSVGRSLVTASDAAAARSAIGAGTGNGTVTGISSSDLSVSGSGSLTVNLNAVGTAGGYDRVVTDSKGRVVSGASDSINNSPGRSLVSATNATGFQVSATRASDVCYEGTFQTTSSIGGPSAITVFLETADTNSTTPGDWTVRARQQNSNTVTLAVALNQVDIEPWSICRRIEAGKHVRIRYGSVTGTATASINSEQQEVTL